MHIPWINLRDFLATHSMRWVLALSIVLLPPFIISSTWAQENSQQIGSSPQLAVLKNGNVLHGVVQDQGKEADPSTLTFQLVQGSRLVLNVEDVWFICDSMEEAYWGKLSRIKASDIESQIKLFHWCIQQKQFEFARNQIDILLEMAIRPSRLNFLNEQLVLAEQRIQQPVDNVAAATTKKKPVDARVPAEHFKAQVPTELPGNLLVGGDFDKIEMVFEPLPSLSGPTSSIAKSKPERTFKTIRSPLDAQPSEVVQVGYNAPVNPAGGPPSTSHAEVDPVHQPVSIKELDKICRDLPRGSLGNFRKQVEKTLVMRCSDCHKMDSKILPLLHAGRLQNPTRRMTQRNLHSSLRFVDKSNPLGSRLLAAATTAHGGAKTPGVPIGSPSHEKMKKWVISVSDHPDLVDFPESPKIIQENDVAKVPKLDTKTATEEDFSLLFDPPVENGQEPEFKPKDEFDPEVFNRMMHKRK